MLQFKFNNLVKEAPSDQTIMKYYLRCIHCLPCKDLMFQRSQKVCDSKNTICYLIFPNNRGAMEYHLLVNYRVLSSNKRFEPWFGKGNTHV